MKTDRWRRIDQLLQDASSLPPQQREAWLRQACADDHDLYREVESLLSHYDNPLPFLEEPALNDDIELAPEQLLIDVGEDPLIGQTIARYRIDRRIAAGGMGVVYEASRHEGDFEHRIAVKVLHTWINPGELLRRFRTERQSLARLSHPNIAHLLDAGVLPGGMPYLMMELIDGMPIDEYCDTHRLTVTQRLRLFQTVCHCVHFAHQNLVVHRDLKPSNILVTPDGTPKLLDFGVAKLLVPEGDDRPAPTMTQTRHAMLTVDYASPEQLSGENVTTETDVYSLGVILYQLLTGLTPHGETSGSLEERMRSVQQREPRRPSTAIQRTTSTAGDQDGRDVIAERCRKRGTTVDRLHRRLRGDLDNIVMMAMRSEPYRRYPSAREFADDIQRHLEGLPVHARKDTFRYRTTKFIRRNKAGVISAALIVLLMMVGTATTWWQAHVASQQRDAARIAEQQAEQRAEEARAAEQRALHEAEHATIEADSAHEIAQFLSEAFLLSGADRSEEELDRAQALLNQKLQRIRRQYDDQPHLRANLIDAIGEVFLHLHMYEDAQALLNEAMDIRLDEFGPESLEVARSYESLGTLHYTLGEYVEAADLFAKALRLHRELPVGVHTDVSMAANNLAVAKRALGELDQAEALHEEALAIRRREHGDESPLVAESLNNLAGIAIARAEYERAESMLRDALEIRRKKLGESHPLVAQSVNNLAVVQQHAGKPDAAESSLREAIRLYRELPSENTDELARSLANLAGFLQIKGDYDEARSLLDEALILNRRLHGDDHPHSATILVQLALVDEAMGNLDAAREHWSKVLQIRQETFPENHPKVALALSGYGGVLTSQGRADEAEPFLRDAVRISQESVPSDHPLARRAVINLAACLIQLDKLDEAGQLLDQVERQPLDAQEQRALQQQREKLNARREENSHSPQQQSDPPSPDS